MRALELVRAAAARIGGDSARLDAEVLVAHALGLTRAAVLLDNPPVDPAAVEPLVARRVAGEPVAYIVGRQEFWSLDLEVTRDVLIPRADSETLIVEALRRFATDRRLHVLDLGTGSGALILAALSEWRRATGVATDVSAAALAVACRNAERLGLARRCRFIATDWAAGVDDRFDLILSNPPYVGDSEVVGRGVREFEPAGALFAGTDGLDAYRRLLPQLRGLLAVAGFAIVEIGHAQAAAVLAIGTASGLAGSVAHDLAGRDRAIVFQAA
jgi:release factor glutamine methyltransferase